MSILNHDIITIKIVKRNQHSNTNIQIHSDSVSALDVECQLCSSYTALSSTNRYDSTNSRTYTLKFN